MRLRTGDRAPRLRLVDVEGRLVMFGARARPALVCFFGDAACAFCNVYVYELIRHYEQLARRGVEVIVLYNATQEAVWRFVAGRPRPFPIIADAPSIAFRACGVERSWWGKLRGLVLHAPTFLRGLRMVGMAGLNANATMPADFLIDGDGTVVEAHYGADPGDHIPFRRIEAFADRCADGGSGCGALAGTR